jgi:N-acetylmuramoyl-L-alanine amidase
MRRRGVVNATVLRAPSLPEWKASPNYAEGRGTAGYSVLAVVIHVSEGSLASCDSWFLNRASRVSAHYCVGRNGEIHQYVRETDTAWHAGRKHGVSAPLVLSMGKVNPNLYTVGIEHEGYAESVWTDEQYEQSARLIASIAVRWQFPITADTVIPHRDIYSKKTCPGLGDVAKLYQMARWRASTAIAPVEAIRP